MRTLLKGTWWILEYAPSYELLVSKTFVLFDGFVDIGLELISDTFRFDFVVQSQQLPGACLFTQKYDSKSSLWRRLCSAWFWAFLAYVTDREMNINDNVCAFGNTKWCLLGFLSVNHMWWSLCRLQIISTPIENLRA